MKKGVFAGLLLLLSCQAFSQVITIRDARSGEPASLATLTSAEPRAFTTTNAEGKADISQFRGSEQIQVRLLGYRTLVKSFADLAAGEYTLYLEPSNLNLEEVVVAATRWREESGHVPFRIISITPKAIQLQNPQTAADLLGLSGKVFIQKSQQGGGSPVIRGFATNRLLYSVDGVRMNTAIFRGGNIQNVINLDPFTMERTEVLFGPGSVIYGSDAIGGVMSFRTLTPQFSLDDDPLVSGKAVARYSTANTEKTAHFDVSIGWKKWATVTSFSTWDYGHLRQGSHGPEDYLKPYYVQRIDSIDRVVEQDDPLMQIPSGYSQSNLMQKIRYRAGKHWDFLYTFQYSETSPYGRYDRHNRTRNGLPRYAEWYYGPQKWMMNLLTVSHTGTTLLYDEMDIRLAQQSFGESRISRDLNHPNREIRTEEVRAISANLDLTKRTGARNQLFYGLEFIRNDVYSTGNDEHIADGTVLKGPSRYPLADWTSVAAYINDDLFLTDRFTLEAGMRYNYFLLNADFSDNLAFYPLPFSSAGIGRGALTGSIGAAYRVSESYSVNASIGTAFRSPNVDDIGKVFDSEPGTVTVPNPDLEAEYAYTFDVGFKKVFGNVARLDVTGYYTLLRNAMVRRDYLLNEQDSILYDGTLSKVQAIQNAAVAYVYGLQAGIEVKLPANFTFSSDLNLQKGTEELDDGSTSPSRHAVPMFGISRLTYATGRLSLQCYAVYQGARNHADLAIEERGKVEIYAKDADGNTYAPAWYTVNLKANVLLTDVFSIGIGVENITDQRYRPYSSGISGAGRNFVVSIRAKF